MRRAGRRSALLVGATALAVGVLAPAAGADVRVTPTEAIQGDAVDLTFDVVEDQPGAYTDKVELVLPDDAPVAEVDPLSVPDWAPKVTYTEAHQPAQGQGSQTQGHTGGGTVTSSIIWYRVAKPASPAATSQLRVSMGPLPQIDTLAFTVVQSYSNGKVRVIPPGSGPVLTLRPGAAGSDAAGTHAHGAFTPQPAAASSGAWPLALGLVGGVTCGLLMALLAVGRRRRTPAEEAPLDEVLEPATPERDRTTSDA